MSNGNKPHYLNPKHPNYDRWKRSREIAIERGKFVKTVVEKYKTIKNLKILDIGSGYGGTIFNFIGNGNEIYSVEIDEFKLKHQPEDISIKKFLTDAYNLPFDEKFDLIILQDFIEHIENPHHFLSYIKTYLKEDGIIYLSTPNRLSIINILSDPHWGFPFISLCSRKIIKKIFLPFFRRSEMTRKDIAQLLSLKDLIRIFNDLNFEYTLNTKFATNTLFKNPQQIIWSNLHTSLFYFLKKLGLNNILIKLSNDKTGLINKYITPTFYITIKSNSRLI